jgi:indolepyruvate ferredoxin oxidoreductase alpha subunit
MAVEAFELSERIGRPVILRPTTRVCHSYASVELKPDLPRVEIEGFTKDAGRWAIFPKLTYENKLKIEDNLSSFAQEREGVVSVWANGNAEHSAHSSRSIGLVAGGVSWQYLNEALERIGQSCSHSEGDATCSNSSGRCIALMKAETYPLPERSLATFLENAREVLVFEELDPFVEDELLRFAGARGINVKIRGKRTGDLPGVGEYSAALCEAALRKFLFPKESADTLCAQSADSASAQGAGSRMPRSGDSMPAKDTVSRRTQGADPPPLPLRLPVLCAGCPHRGSFFAVKEAVKGCAATFSGDIGCYTLGNAMPLDMVDTCLCMGADITQAQGMDRAEALRIQDAGTDTKSRPLRFAFIGDSTFFHTGVPGLMNAVWNRADIILCILDNSTTAMTGGQPHPGMGQSLGEGRAGKLNIAGIAEACGVDSLRRVNAFDLEACKDAVRAASEEEGVRVIIFEGPCINLVPKGDALTVSEACTGCGLCVNKLGCPALSMKDSPDGTSKRAVVDFVLCTGCGLCAEVCPCGALQSGGGDE